MNQVFYSPGHHSAVDYAVQDAHGVWRSLFTGQSADELKRDYPDLQRCPEDEVERLQVAHACTAPEAIGADEYHDARNCMPPINVAQVPGSSSFMLAEMYLSHPRITTIYVAQRQADGTTRYYRFRDRASLTHRQILARINEVQQGSHYDA